MKRSVSLLLALVLCLVSCAAMAQVVIVGDKERGEGYVTGQFADTYSERSVKGSAGLSVFESPGGNSSANLSRVLDTLSPGTIVEMSKYDITGKWVLVLYNERNNCGWVYLDSLEKIS